MAHRAVRVAADDDGGVSRVAARGQGGEGARPVPVHLFDIATVSQVRASRQFRVTVDTNRYSVPAQYAGHALTLKTYPDRLCLYHGEQLAQLGRRIGQAGGGGAEQRDELAARSRRRAGSGCPPGR